jgi:NitT/TauT family transport system substrate-binding protein
MSKSRGRATAGRIASAVVATAVLAVVAAGCGDDASGGSGGGNSAGATKVTIRLPWTMTGYMDPLVYAKDQGYFKQAGLDVDLPEGKGSVTTAQTVANGSDDFGFVDASSVAPLISKGAPLKVVAVFQQQTGVAFVHRPDIQLSTERDLLGHTVVHSASDNGTQLLPAVLAKGGIKSGELDEQVVQPTSLGQAFLATKNSVMVGSINSTFQALKKTQPDLVATDYSQFGINVLSFGLVTSDKMIKEHTDEVRSVVAAVTKGWQAAIKDPQAASDAAAKAFPDVDASIEVDQLKETLKRTHTAASAGKPLGYMAKQDWRQTVDLMHRYGGLNPVKPLSDYYTNQFVPKA